MSDHEKYMLRCIQLAKLGQGFTKSNPLVGSVLVYNGNIIGEGFHERYGKAHAEVNCIESVSKANAHIIPKATLYVNLEPCSHTGKTPPCSHAIVKAGIKKVVIGTQDLNPAVASLGIKYLEDNNIEVISGISSKACYKLNKVFFTIHKKERAYIKLKWAETSDCYIGETEKNLAISNEFSNIISHKFRTRVDGILVGYNTALNDKPALNARHWQGAQPARIFIDWECELPIEIIIKEGQRNIVLNAKKTECKEGIEYIQVDKSAKDIAQKLQAIDINSVLVEGGAKTHQLFINENIWDEAIIIKSNHSIGKGIKAACMEDSNLINVNKNLSDNILHYSNSEFLR